ncbi:hypothetical protein JCM10908_006207 [Rhodotorula pacifica]|uniref:uncharacterized protein n=1 Tax=Rhodotorula pacifica TaxID=1495444 RepID=UPI00317727C1
MLIMRTLATLLMTFLFAAQLVWANQDLPAPHPPPGLAIDGHASSKHRLLRQYRRSGLGRRQDPPSGTASLLSSKADHPVFVAGGEPFFASQNTDSTTVAAFSRTSGGKASAGASNRLTTVISSGSKAQPLSTSAFASPTAATSMTSAPNVVLTSFPSPSTSTSTSATSTSSTSAASAAAATVKPVLTAMPGRTLSVFPIGLIVFSSLNGIALLVMAYMFWERRGYARQFTLRKRREKEEGERKDAVLSGAN